MNKVVVVDYGMGNLHSVAKALETVATPNTQVAVSSDPHFIKAADRVVFPGVGAIRDCRAALHQAGIDQVITELFTNKPILAICVGMQMLFDHSEENDGVDCLGLLPGRVKFFGRELADANGERLKVPHMGWNQVQQIEHPLWQNISQNSRFYFVHSYYVKADNTAAVKGRCEYGHFIDVAVAQNNVFAVQFHPEKSAQAGLQLLANFMAWNGEG
ncbi:imidazole glycerol phosphate synthase subunit HisH [Spartinivicinus poritis]|uniref:Imidazole glycerol phosphate synthase subunit HisH n=1 Tax=Spartinivicinus poritis TaxID=2994640 RepID=A0ABT5U7Y5_9GAMM|nr:imidazole glycerol phosphate synthase subunit HisH [Spartinivicinus sp. A2-2]MDE1462488.1 imidazole glycerol phosphate synthase subunit HisH [Spartinivicinus sp. A2-2]